jgi:type IV secretion system protein VirB3
MAELPSGLNRNRIHRALSRPNLLLGADRELVLVVGLASAILVFVVLTVYAAILGAVLWIFAVGCLRMMAKSDPLMRPVYLRYIAYRQLYRPTTSPWRRF